MSILIFGASRGIGRVLADKLASEREDDVYVFARTWEERGIPNQKFIKSDFENINEFEDNLSGFCAKVGKINSVIFCQKYRGPEVSWAGEIDVALSSTKIAVETCVQNMTEGSSVIVIGSNAGHLIAPDQSVAYHASKAALEQMVRYYAVKYGNRKISFNVVSPAITLKPENEKFYEENCDLRRAIEDVIPMGRMCKSSDIVEAVSFFMGSSFITGQVLAVDGGLSLCTHESIAIKNYKKK